MSSGFIDPNNHAPEVSAEDDWGDAEETPNQAASGATALPPKRKVAERPAADLEAAPEPGLRIEPNLLRLEKTEQAHKLEVQEINDSVVRLEQERPPPLRVERQITFHERPSKEEDPQKLAGEKQEWGKARVQSKLWMVFAGGAVALIVITVMWLQPMLNKRDLPAANAATPSIPEGKTISDSSQNFDELLMKQQEAAQIFRTYSQAIHLDQIMPVIRDGKILKDTLANHWKPLGIPKQWNAMMETKWLIADLDGYACGILEGNLPDHSNFAAYFVMQEGRLLLDWKATTGFSTATFSDLEQGMGDSSEIRGILSPAEFYTAEWPEAEYCSYRLISPDESTLLWCFVRRGGINEWQIGKIFGAGEIVREASGPRKITLRLERGPEGTPPNQWLVGEMLHIDWVNP